VNATHTAFTILICWLFGIVTGVALSLSSPVTTLKCQDGVLYNCSAEGLCISADGPKTCFESKP
jgi:hypothetical protein